MELLKSVFNQTQRTKKSIMKANSLYKMVFLIPIAVFGCAKMNDEINDCNGLVDVSLSLSGQISVWESPLEEETKANGDDSNDLYGIQVFQNGEKYAYGLFDKSTQPHIYLHSGKEYKFVCTLIKNGKTSILNHDNGLWPSSLINRTYNYNETLPETMSVNGRTVLVFGRGASFPFVVPIKDSERCKYYAIRYQGDNVGHSYHLWSDYSTGSDYSSTIVYGYYAQQVLSGGFIYSSDVGMDYLSQSITITPDAINATYPKIERYYGECQNYTPTTNGNISIDMKSVSFLLQYNIYGITDGSVSLTIKNGKKVFVDISGVTNSISSPIESYSFNNIVDAWTYDDYTENLTVSMKWMRGVGIEQDLGSQVIQVKRNALNTITIALDTD